MQIRGELSAGWVTAAVIITLITLTTIVGNSVMLVAVRRAARAPAHCALTSLLAADLLVGTCVLPIAALSELATFEPPWVICAWWSTMDVLSCTASILSLCTLGWERWWGITAPLALSQRGRRVKMLVALLWPASTIIALPTAFVPSPKHYYEWEVPQACSANTNVGYVFASVTCSFYIPTSVMLFFYAMILRSLSSSPNIRAHRGQNQKTNIVQKGNNAPVEESKYPKARVQDKEKAQGQNKQLAPTKLRPLSPAALIPSPLRAPSPSKSGRTLSSIIPRQRRATQTIVMLMSFFLICWTPFFVMLPIDSICFCVPDVIWQLCTWLGYANSALNPLVYAAASPSVRRALPASIPLTTSSKSNDATNAPNTRRK